MGIGLLGALFLIMFTLKLLGKIALSWWWVTAPLWGSFIIALVFTVVMFIFCDGDCMDEWNSTKDERKD